jgi:hypothetical protein
LSHTFCLPRNFLRFIPSVALLLAAHSLIPNTQKPIYRGPDNKGAPASMDGAPEAPSVSSSSGHRVSKSFGGLGELAVAVAADRKPDGPGLADATHAARRPVVTSTLRSASMSVGGAPRVSSSSGGGSSGGGAEDGDGGGAK